MPHEERFGDVGEALAAIQADRVRARRRVRAANAWFYPGMALLVALLVASPAFEIGVLPMAVVTAVGSPLLTFLHRRHTGMTARMDGGLPAVVVIAVLLGLTILGLFLLSALSLRFGSQDWVPLFAIVAFAVMLLGAFLLERAIERGRRAV